MLFKDKKLQAQLETDGYVIIPFLRSDELEKLKGFYKNVHGDEDPPLFIENIHMTSWCESSDYKHRIGQGLQTVFREAANRFFEKVRTLNHVFIIKKSGQQTTFKVHQDWNVIDEAIYQSANVWIPLHDVSEESGALWVLKGSHRIDRKIRGAGFLFPDYGPFENELQREAISVKLKAGEAIVFFHSVIHGSPPNYAGHHRLAACFSVIPGDAPLCIYFQKNAQSPLERHQPKDDFMYGYKYLRTDTLTIPPTEIPVAVLPPFQQTQITADELKVFLKPRQNLFSRLFGRR